jgi:oligopeptide transport system substrate-binding protein
MFNVTRFPFDNSKLRKALSLAINRPEIVKNMCYSGETPAMSVIPKQMKLQEKPPFPFFAPTKANELFEEALRETGLTRSTFPKVKISGHHKSLLMAQIIQQQWKKVLNLDSEIDLCEWHVYFEKVGNRDYQIGAMGWETWVNDPIYNLEHFKYRNSKLNWTGWENPEFIRCLDLSDQEKDIQKREELLKKAENILMQEMPVAPLFHVTKPYIVQDRLKNFYFTTLGHLILTHAYIEESD